MYSLLDRLIIELDRGLRTLAGAPQARRPSPADGLEDVEIPEAERRDTAALMRVNHCGEVCAQALYQGQALASDNAALKLTLSRAAAEEEDHLAWTQSRIEELGGRTSLLNPLWYAGSYAIGYAAGKLGDPWSLGFLAETERQVERHLEGHLERLTQSDPKTRAILEAMKHDEAGHARMAVRYGARDLPLPAKRAMQWAAKAMTSTSYWV
jgi:ubiquinone biosynthesis monooxygenase Coq7